MAKEVVSQVFRYTDVTLPSGAVMMSAEINVEGGSTVTNINDAQIKVGDREFRMYIYFQGKGEDDYTYNLNGVYSKIDIKALITEIISYVMANIA
jgi:hypothetical protein